ncbi:MAG: ester cyclase [Luteolibacter sp.]
MSTPYTVTAFYERIWNAGDFHLIPELLTEDFVFRGSLGRDTTGHAAFEEYTKMVRSALGGYHCEILECVYEGDKAFAKMRFSGTHTGEFRECEPTGKLVEWDGAALFRFDGNLIAELWVLGDLERLDELLLKNAAEAVLEKAEETLENAD